MSRNPQDEIRILVERGEQFIIAFNGMGVEEPVILLSTTFIVLSEWRSGSAATLGGVAKYASGPAPLRSPSGVDPSTTPI